MMLKLIGLLMLMGNSHCVPRLLTTYQHTDPASGRRLTCQRCPPGTHMLRHCSASQRTQCAPCPPYTFTGQWNYLQRCLFCNEVCEENQVMKEPCSALHNTMCLCKPGYFRDSNFCSQHTQCPSGYGVKLKGTADADTVCERCPEGTYSQGKSSVVPCLNHTDCESLGLVTVLKGDVWHNSVCASCNTLRTRGGLELLRGVIPDFFSHHKINKRKLQRFVTQFLFLQETVDSMRHEALQKEDLQERINKWAKEAEAENLVKLPEMLRRWELYGVAEKLQEKMNKLTDVTLCNTFVK